MKKKLSILLLLTFFLLESCKKDFSNEKNFDLNEYNFQLRELTNIAGDIHNNGMIVSLSSKNPASLESHTGQKTQSVFPSSPILPQDPFAGEITTQTIISNSEAFVNSQSEFAELGLVTDERTFETMRSTLIVGTEEFLTHQLDSVSLKLGSDNLLSSREIGMIDEIKDVFINARSENVPDNSIHEYLSVRLNNLQNKYANTVWNINEGEAFSGMLNVAVNSNDYWDSATPQATTLDASFSKVKEKSFLIQVDAFGYIVGWATAVYDDFSRNNLHPSGEKRRIGKAALSAIQFSTFAGLRGRMTWFGYLLPQIDKSKDSDPIVVTKPNSLYLPTPLASQIAYYETMNDVYMSNSLSFTTVFFNPADDKYYTDNSRQFFIPNGYYKSNDLASKLFYVLRDGLVIEIIEIETNMTPKFPKKF